MKYQALATDYDGTIATHGLVDAPTVAALHQFHESGRRLILVTGRLLDELLGIFPSATLFDRIVAENGAVVYCPLTSEGRELASPPATKFLDVIRKRNVNPLSVGRVIVATVEPCQTIILEVIKELGLDLQVIFNKGTVMVLPVGMNKARGLKEALKDLQLSVENVVGVGDAENDHDFLQSCGFSAAVANALPGVKTRVQFVCEHDHGAGVRELISKVLREDPADKSVRVTEPSLMSKDQGQTTR